MADEPEPMPPYKPPRPWAYLAVVVVFRILNSLYWAFAGGLGWGFGSAVGSFAPWPEAVTLGGMIGLALVLIAVLTINPANQRSEYTPIQLAVFGGAAAGYASLALLLPLDPNKDLVLLLGAGMGIFVGVFTIVMKQYFAPLNFWRACAIAITGSALFTGIGLLIEGPLGCAAAGALCLFGVALLAEFFRPEPAVEVDASAQPVRVIPRSEMCRHTIRQSWSLTYPDAWSWHGLLAGLAASLWALWATDQPNRDVVRQPFLVCGGLAAVVIIAMRLGIPKTAAVDEKRNNSNEPTD